MTISSEFTIIPETENNAAAIEALHEDVFGPGRFARTAFRVREGCAPDARFSFVALKGDELVGSVRLTAVRIAHAEAFLLGPLCVARALQNFGIGRALVQQGLSMVREKVQLPVLLVGDAPYYAPLGFERTPKGISMPGPVDYSRLLIAWPEEYDDHKREDYQGVIKGLSPLAVPHGCEGAEEQG
ncbi:MAG: N-acetyltransferase [Hyphomicrobiales bacterium]